MSKQDKKNQKLDDKLFGPVKDPPKDPVLRIRSARFHQSVLVGTREVLYAGVEFDCQLVTRQFNGVPLALLKVTDIGSQETALVPVHNIRDLHETTVH